MRVAGFGMRATAGEDSLRAALAVAGGADLLAALPQHAARVRALADALGLPFRGVAGIAGMPTLTQSPRVQAQFGTGSVAEAVALAAAGPGATLTAPRATAPDGVATCAIAQTALPPEEAP